MCLCLFYSFWGERWHSFTEFHIATMICYLHIKNTDDFKWCFFNSWFFPSKRGESVLLNPVGRGEELREGTPRGKRQRPERQCWKAQERLVRWVGNWSERLVGPEVGEPIRSLSGWWCFKYIFGIFTPKNWGRWSHFDEHIFQMVGSTTNQLLSGLENSPKYLK